MIFNGWVFQVNGLAHDPEIEISKKSWMSFPGKRSDGPENENFRKISGWIFQDLAIRVKLSLNNHKSLPRFIISPASGVSWIIIVGLIY